MNDGVNFSQQSQEAQEQPQSQEQPQEQSHLQESAGAASFSAPESTPEEFEYCLDDILASENFELGPHEANRAGAAPAGAIRVAAGSEAGEIEQAALAPCVPFDELAAQAQTMSLQEAADALRNDPRADRRKRRRALISAPVRVRGINLTDAVVDEITTTIDVSRAGILFISSSPNYARGMEVAVIFPYSTAPAALHAEQQGRVVRSFETPEGRYAVAIALGEGIGEDIVDACGRKLCDSTGSRPAAPVVAAETKCTTGLVAGVTPGFAHGFTREPDSKRPLVLVVDADEMTRATLKAYLGGEGYDVMAASNCEDAREVLNMFTPALVIAEVEGEGLPGYDLCAHVKSTPRLKHIPVVLTTSSGYPSDYSNAHSLGAIVCMTKPYKQERLGHVVRLLAPPPAEFCAQKSGAAGVRPADPSRRCGYNSAANGSSANGNASGANANGANSAAKLAANALKRLKFPSFR